MVENLCPKEAFLASLERCSSDNGFIPAFYTRFLASSDAVRYRFLETDFEKQNEMLLRSLKLSAGATRGSPDSLKELAGRAESHDRNHLNVKPIYYDYWLQAVIETAREFDSQWDQEIESAWQSILGHVIKHMIVNY